MGDNADSCDRCCSPCHHSCLRKVSHPVEAYQVCNSCLNETDTLEEEDSTDDDQASSSMPPAVVCASVVCSEDEEEKLRSEQAGIVQSRLSYMLQYLELDVNNMLAPSRRHAIIQKVKKTMTWQERHRSSQALKDKIVDLDTFMEKLLR